MLFGLAVPIWLASLFVGVIGSLKIPVTDLLLAFTPLLAGATLVFRDEGARGLVKFLQRAVDLRALAKTPWVLVALLLAPVIYILTVGALRLAGHPWPSEPDLLRLPLLAAIMFVLAIGEEAGWTGYLTDPMQARFGALGASVIIALPWWIGHLPSILQIGGGTSDIAWWLPGAIALRTLITWLYNNTGRCVAAAVVFHTLLNVGRWVSYPTVDTHYDPTYQAAGYVVATALALLIVAVWGPRTLTR